MRWSRRRIKSSTRRRLTHLSNAPTALSQRRSTSSAAMKMNAEWSRNNANIVKRRLMSNASTHTKNNVALRQGNAVTVNVLSWIGIVNSISLKASAKNSTKKTNKLSSETSNKDWMSWRVSRTMRIRNARKTWKGWLKIKTDEFQCPPLLQLSSSLL